MWPGACAARLSACCQWPLPSAPAGGTGCHRPPRRSPRSGRAADRRSSGSAPDRSGRRPGYGPKKTEKEAEIGDVVKEVQYLDWTSLRLLRVSWERAWHLMDRAVARGLVAPPVNVPAQVAVDEKAAGKGQDYITVPRYRPAARE